MMTPIAAPAMATSGIDFDPTSSSCRISSRHSYGGVTADRKTRQEKIPSSPNHSKNPLNRPVAELATEDITAIRRRGSGGCIPATVVDPRSLISLDLCPASRAHCSDACAKSRREVRYKRTPGQCCRPYNLAGYSCPSGTHLLRRSDPDTTGEPQSWNPHRARQ